MSGSCLFGRVAGPVASGLAHPSDCGAWGQAEEVGEDGGGQLGSKIKQRGPASGLGVDTEGAQAAAEPGSGDRLAGQPAGK